MSSCVILSLKLLGGLINTGWVQTGVVGTIGTKIEMFVNRWLRFGEREVVNLRPVGGAGVGSANLPE